MIKRALLSVSDKTGIVSFAKSLHEMGVQLISTGGTERVLAESGLPVTNISEITRFPECLDGRVKTLHPAVHAGILARRDLEEHREQLKELAIETIDLVVINLYPFKETIARPDCTLEEAIENIDIGGPTMLRSAAKNFRDVLVLTDPADYDGLITSLKADGEVDGEERLRYALKVFETTAAYDALIAAHLAGVTGRTYPEKLTLTFEKVDDLRYGENPHQSAAFYREPLATPGTLSEAKQLHGKALSFNNINDTNGALALLKEFREPCVVAVKHTNPSGVGVGFDLHDAYMKAYEADPKSIFGGIIAANRPVDVKTARKINEIFVEIVVAPAFEEEALEILTQKKNIRLLELPNILHAPKANALDLKKVEGGLLVQGIDAALMKGDMRVVTHRVPTDKEMKDLLFSWKVVKHIKSNGIVVAKGSKTLGVGPGQVNRIWAVENSLRQSLEQTKGAVLASDAFFPFADSIEACAKAGITAIVQPGGSMRDEEVVEMANQYGIAMVFTDMRHFKH